MNNSFKSLLQSTMARMGITGHAKQQITQRMSIKAMEERDPGDPKATTSGSQRRAHHWRRRNGNGGTCKHYISAHREGPKRRQVGIAPVRGKDGQVLRMGLLMQTYIVDHALHATKGWRTRSHAARATVL